MDANLKQLEMEQLQCIRIKAKEDLLDLTRGMIPIQEDWNKVKTQLDKQHIYTNMDHDWKVIFVR